MFHTCTRDMQWWHTLPYASVNEHFLCITLQICFMARATGKKCVGVPFLSWGRRAGASHAQRLPPASSWSVNTNAHAHPLNRKPEEAALTTTRAECFVFFTLIHCAGPKFPPFYQHGDSTVRQTFANVRNISSLTRLVRLNTEKLTLFTKVDDWAHYIWLSWFSPTLVINWNTFTFYS